MADHAIITVIATQLLLLGAGASGKSTVLKQMRLIHNVSFTPAELECESVPLSQHSFTEKCSRQKINDRLDYRQLVFSNVVNGMKLIIDAMDEWEMSVESHNRVRITLFHFIPHQPTHSRN